VFEGIARDQHGVSGDQVTHFPVEHVGTGGRDHWLEDLRLAVVAHERATARGDRECGERILAATAGTGHLRTLAVRISDDLRAFPWKYLPGLSGDLFAVMFVTAISTLLNTTGIEFVTKREADL